MLSTLLVQLLTVACALASPHPHAKGGRGGGHASGGGRHATSTGGRLVPIGGGAVWLASSDFDGAIGAMPPKNTTDDTAKLYYNFQPKLEVQSGCPSYPAVDEDGHPSDPQGNLPDCSNNQRDGGQVYARLYEFAGPATDKKPVGTAIMYAWYFPDRGYAEPKKGFKEHDWQQIVVWLSGKSDPQITKISYSTPNGYKTVLPPLSLENTTPLVAVSIENDHRAVGPASSLNGKQQPLVVWYALPKAAWKTLMSDKVFNGDRCPLADAEFDKHIMAASQ